MNLGSTPLTRWAGMVNFRDVGGLVTGAKGQTGHGILYRGDAPHHEDPRPVRPPGWPPTLVLDLREPCEVRNGHPLANGHTRVLQMPLLAPAHIGDWRTVASLTELYLGSLLRAGERIAEVLDLLTSTGGSALVHCAAGKDRTGVLVAVLLRAAGVPREAVLEDYLRTEHNLPALMAKLAWDLARLDAQERLHAQHIVGTSPPALLAVLDELDGAPGGVRGWLRARGASATTITAWTRQLVPD